MANNLGQKIKRLRQEHNMTLKELSGKTDLSIGFLSQLERGLTTVAVDALERIAKALGVDITYFFAFPLKPHGEITRSYEKQLIQYDQGCHFINYLLSGKLEGKRLFPRIVELLPGVKKRKDVSFYSHQGEEFIYVLEGILTLILRDGHHELFPGDSAHFSSEIPHNWVNNTTRKVVLLVVNCPNPFEKTIEQSE
ncbi:MAG: DNA-binding protein [Candidatus Aminicenantes bacterium]|nr:MAG: DNA-binding protein [Candidatus Aminicenantes bacterium]